MKCPHSVLISASLSMVHHCTLLWTSQVTCKSIF